jgi:hypothetical protein
MHWCSHLRNVLVPHPGGLPTERGSGCCGGGPEVVLWSDEPPFVELGVVDDRASVAEAGEVKRPDVHDRFEPVEFVLGRLDVLAVSVDGSVDALLVGPTRVP